MPEKDHPQKSFDAISQTALKAIELYKKHQSSLKERLGEDIAIKLAEDLSLLGVQVPGAKVSQAVGKVATAEQEAALQRGYELVSAVRTAISRQKPSADIKKAYGVGIRTSARVVKDVKVAIQLIVTRATEQPDEAHNLKLLKRDIEALQKRFTEIGDADLIQEEVRAKAPQSTKERNTTARRIIKSTDDIIAAGVLEFAAQATERKEFQDLIGAGNPNYTPEEKAKRNAAAKEKRSKTK